jgi:hAT family C-terminal dimerisation region
LALVFQPFVDLLLGEEGEYYITSSPVVPRLVAEKKRIEDIMTQAANGDTSSGITRPALVAGWKTNFDRLWQRYVSAFIEDEIFLSATVFDPRFGLRALPQDLRKKAWDAAMALLEKEYAAREAEHRQHQNADGLVGPLRPDDGARAAGARRLGVDMDDGFDPNSFLRDQGVVPVGDDGRRPYREPLDELAAIVQLPNMAMSGNPITVYAKDSRYNLELSRSVVLDVLAVPAGEAPSERVFSIASRIQTHVRTSMTPGRLCQEVFVAKNQMCWPEF